MDKIPLSEMLAQLRQELLQTQWEGEGSDLKFLIEDIEIELQVATTKEAGGGGGVKFSGLQRQCENQCLRGQDPEAQVEAQAEDFDRSSRGFKRSAETRLNRSAESNGSWTRKRKIC